ncbi:Equilibrative nucleoside transporter, putative [Perkinsus marinus ATCC 50983]|uniref:Equilibrative nucleoside transporter, putative n=1 Tax=Perkinsus marinus (strain ATCC 50983 / TXsc) TaxID=423536 RepID=C5KS97_PERM5|nr:Equilibrative nucleoside transporter, putative [Perkinsus marinus ATCC 50983]EER12678.1 Equilibrative nucleoside transporter, putative [Perkinsus marinus ATCC 50983]|eukprot:XP_002780883.1 Equilibrative nucleoside transporter, putative [Perkinsus marinus ATCC 50983]
MAAFGFIALLPFNLILTELDFLSVSFQHHYAAALSFLYAIAVNIVQILLIWYGNRFPFKPRIILGCVLMAAGTMLTAVVAIAVGNSTVAFSLALICMFALGVGYAVFEPTALGIAALCPPSCTLSIMVGEGIAGLLPWPMYELFNLILRSAGISAVPEWRCLILFTIGSVLALAMIPVYALGTARHPYVVKVLEIEQNRRVSGLHVRQTRRPVLAILRDVAPMGVCVWLAMAITFIIFPAQSVLWQPQSPSNVNFVAQVTFTFQVLDTVGRAAPSFLPTLDGWKLFFFTIARACFIPLFVCTAKYPNATPFTWDWFKHLEMALLALTNGMGVTWSMVAGPQKVASDEAEQEVAGYFMPFALVDGILWGSVLALLLNVALGQ